MADSNQDEKPRLTDVLGALVSGVAHARGVADSEVMNIARAYRRHEYLRGLTVPRLRVNKVVLELPVLLDRIVPAQPAKLNTPRHVATEACKALKEAAGDFIRFLDATRHKMTDEVAERARTLMHMLENGSVDLLKEFGAPILQQTQRISARIAAGAVDELASSDAMLRDALGDVAERVLRNMFARTLNAKQRAESERTRSFDLGAD